MGMKKIGAVLLAALFSLFLGSGNVGAQGEIDPFSQVSPVATTGGVLGLEMPGEDELVGIPDVVSPLTVCEQQTQYWGISYVLLAGMILYGLMSFRPKTAFNGLFIIGGSGAALVFLNAVIGCACTTSLWCRRFWVVVLLSALIFAWYTLSFRQKRKK